eukprot:SAG22_NODE_77_length_22125_cov_46.140016_5_plen_209_part_00
MVVPDNEEQLVGLPVLLRSLLFAHSCRTLVVTGFRAATDPAAWEDETEDLPPLYYNVAEAGPLGITFITQLEGVGDDADQIVVVDQVQAGSVVARLADPPIVPGMVLDAVQYRPVYSLEWDDLQGALAQRPLILEFESDQLTGKQHIVSKTISHKIDSREPVGIEVGTKALPLPCACTVFLRRCRSLRFRCHNSLPARLTPTAARRWW